MPLIMQQHLVMMNKYAKFGVDTVNTFWVMGYIKNSLTSSSKQTS